MKYLKNLLMILLFAQCLLLFCTCDEKVTKEQEIQMESNLIDFIKCPFNEEFKNNTNLEKYVLKKFGKPDSVWKRRGPIYDNSGIVADIFKLKYEKSCTFWIYRGINKKFEVFAEIFIYNYADLKYGINEETTIRDIENLFGKPKKVNKVPKEKGRPYSYTGYNYFYPNDDKYLYNLYFRFKEGGLDCISVEVDIDQYLGLRSHEPVHSKKNNS